MHLRGIRFRTDDYPSAGHYPFNQRLIRETRALEFTSPITAFVGENGTGKTTVIEAIARKCGIHMWRSQERSRLEVNPLEGELHRYLDAEWADGPVPGAFFGSDTFRYFTRSLDEWASADPGMLEYFGGESLVTKSHGQSMMAYFRSRYRIRGLYLLDEPETALSPRNQVALVEILNRMSAAGHAQFIVATHSPILLACPGARVLSFDHVPVKEVPFRETDHYRLYRALLDHPDDLQQT